MTVLCKEGISLGHAQKAPQNAAISPHQNGKLDLTSKPTKMPLRETMATPFPA